MSTAICGRMCNHGSLPQRQVSAPRGPQASCGNHRFRARFEPASTRSWVPTLPCGHHASKPDPKGGGCTRRQPRRACSLPLPASGTPACKAPGAGAGQWGAETLPMSPSHQVTLRARFPHPPPLSCCSCHLPRTQKCIKLFQFPSDALNQRSKEQSRMPQTRFRKKPIFFFFPHSCVIREKKEGGGDLITLNYHKLYPISRRADFRCKEGGSMGVARGG